MVLNVANTDGETVCCAQRLIQTILEHGEFWEEEA
jgi:hypothetical protein